MIKKQTRQNAEEMGTDLIKKKKKIQHTPITSAFKSFICTELLWYVNLSGTCTHTHAENLNVTHLYRWGNNRADFGQPLCQTVCQCPRIARQGSRPVTGSPFRGNSTTSVCYHTMGHGAAQAVGQKTRQKLKWECATAGGPAKGETRASGGGGIGEERTGGWG